MEIHYQRWFYFLIYNKGVFEMTNQSGKESKTNWDEKMKAHQPRKLTKEEIKQLKKAGRIK